MCNVASRLYAVVSLLYNVTSPLCDVTSPLCDVTSPVYDGSSPLCDQVYWRQLFVSVCADDTPVEIPTRPGIQPTLAAEETSPEGQRWKRVSVSGSDFDIDLQAVEPFKNVLSHGGESACLLWIGVFCIVN